jgi:tight adherence protein C
MMPSFDIMIAVAVFASITLGTWVVLGLVAGRPQRAEDRLQRLLVPAASRGAVEASAAKRQDLFHAKVTAAAKKLGQSLRPSNEESLGKIQLKLLSAGFRTEHAVAVFYGIKLIALLVGLAVSVPFLIVKYGMTSTALALSAGAGGLGFYMPDLFVSRRRKKRAESIFLGLPDALDLMVVCVEAGLGLDAAMRRVSTELIASCPVLCEEMAIANFQVQMGRPRRDVLHDLGRRTGVADVRALAAVLIQAERFGSSIATALRVQSDSMRVKRRQLAEEKAAKCAVMLILPLVLFIFPGIFVVLVGPAGIQISTTMMN